MGGGMPGGIDPSMMAGLMNDPEIMAAMSNPKVMAAMQQCMGNPMAMMQYMDDPEVGPVLQKLMGKMMGGGGMPGMGGGMPDAGASSGGPSVEEVPDDTPSGIEEVD